MMLICGTFRLLRSGCRGAITASAVRAIECGDALLVSTESCHPALSYPAEATYLPGYDRAEKIVIVLRPELKYIHPN
jgi:hypothetical protein